MHDSQKGKKKSAANPDLKKNKNLCICCVWIELISIRAFWHRVARPPGGATEDTGRMWGSVKKKTQKEKRPKVLLHLNLRSLCQKSWVSKV